MAEVGVAVGLVLLDDLPELGDALVADPRVRLVTFTGGVDTARTIAGSLYCAMAQRPHFPRFVAETGGKDFMVVDRAVDAWDAAEKTYASLEFAARGTPPGGKNNGLLYLRIVRHLPEQCGQRLEKLIHLLFSPNHLSFYARTNRNAKPRRTCVRTT